MLAKKSATTFSGRLKGKRLRPGRYRLKLLASVGGLHSAPVTKPFVVSRARK